MGSIMKIMIFAIAAAFLLMTPLTALSMSAMTDEEMDSFTAQAEGSSETTQLNRDNATGYFDSAAVNTVPDFPEADQANSSLSTGYNNRDVSASHGVSIFIYDVSFDLHILNICYGDGDGGPSESQGTVFNQHNRN